MRQDLASGNPSAAMSRLSGLVAHLDRHVQREEDGIFRTMRATDEFLAEINDWKASTGASLSPSLHWIQGRRVSLPR